MRWPNVVGKSRTQPNKGEWHDWKQEIADHCHGRCIYCAISEARFGGVRNFHIEHYRPKKKFPQFENDIKNLYSAGAICNVLKCDMIGWLNHYPIISVSAYSLTLRLPTTTTFSMYQRLIMLSTRQLWQVSTS